MERSRGASGAAERSLGFYFTRIRLLSHLQSSTQQNLPLNPPSVMLAKRPQLSARHGPGEG